MGIAGTWNMQAHDHFFGNSLLISIFVIFEWKTYSCDPVRVQWNFKIATDVETFISAEEYSKNTVVFQVNELYDVRPVR